MNDSIIPLGFFCLFEFDAVIYAFVILMRNIQSVSPFFLLSTIALCLILMVQIKQIYDNKLKYNRYLGYKQFMQEISTEMVEVEKSVNKSNDYVHRLNEALQRHNDKKQKNVSLSKMLLLS